MLSKLLDPNPDRLFPYPVEFPEIQDFYKRAKKCYWIAEEVPLGKDVEQWRNVLNDGERTFLSCILGFFAGADGIVNENLLLRFTTEVQLHEVRAFYSFQIAMEQIHADMYARMIVEFIPRHEDRMKVFRKCQDFEDPIGKKALWAQRWIHDEQSFVFRLVAFSAVEGIFFSASFCAIFWLKQRGLMPGLVLSNELISRDEGLHMMFACFLVNQFNMLDSNDYKEKATKIIQGAVECEKSFVCEALQLDLIGMNAKLMCQYVEYVADHLLVSLGLEKQYNAFNPFEWMHLISVEGKTNFFEKKVSQYGKAGGAYEVDENADF